MNAPKSIKELKKQGTYRKDRHAGRLESAVNLLETAPEPPKNFDKMHADMWNTVCNDLIKLGLLASPDVLIIEIYVSTWFLWRKAVIDFKATNSKVVFRLMNDTAKQLNQMSDKLGFSPKARQHLNISDKPTGKDLLKDFFSRGKF